jgi:type I restriction enzyme, S subunit
MSGEVPEGWRSMSFSEAVAINPKRLLPKDGLVPFLDMASLPLNGADVSVAANREVGSGGSKFQSGDTLFARITPCAENGKLGFVRSIDDGEVAQGSTEFIVMAGRDGLTLPEYIRYLAGWSEVRDQAIGLMEGTSGRQRVPNWAFDEIEVPIPPLAEQRRIAEVLRSIDKQTDLTRRTLAATSAAKNAALIAALHSNSWPNVRVGELLADTQTPMRSGPFGSALLKSELTEQGIPLLGIDNVHVERFVPEYRRFISEAKYQKLARYTVFPNDVMVTIMGTVGRCCVVPEGVGRAISSKHVWTLTLDEQQYSPALLAWQINHEPRVLDQLRGSAQGGIMSAISSETLRNLRVPQPPRTQMLELEQLITSANSTTSRLEGELAGLMRLKRLVAADLLSGRVRVPA